MGTVPEGNAMPRRWVENTSTGPRFIGGELCQPGEGAWVDDGPYPLPTQFPPVRQNPVTRELIGVDDQPIPGLVSGDGNPVDGSGRPAPVVSVGGGLIRSRAYARNGRLVRESLSGPGFKSSDPVVLYDLASPASYGTVSTAVTGATVTPVSLPAPRGLLTAGYRVVTGTAANDRGTVDLRDMAGIPTLSLADTVLAGLYVEQLNAGDLFRLFISSDNLSTSYSTTTNLSRFVLGYNLLEIPLRQLILSGGSAQLNPALTYNSIRAQIAHGNAGGVPTIASICRIELSTGTGVGTIIQDFDDNMKSVFTQAFPYMRSKGLVGGIAVIGETVGKTAGQIDAFDYMTEAELRQVWQAGWELNVHGYYPHNQAGTLDSNEEKIATDMAGNKKWLTDRGLTGGEMHYVYPAGQVVFPASINALRRNGMVSARCTSNQNVNTQIHGVSDPYLLTGVNVAQATGLATILAAIDDAINSGSCVALYWHRIVAAVTDTGNEISIADARTIWDYIATKRDAGQLTPVTRSQWWAGLGAAPDKRPVFDRASGTWVQV